MSQQTILMHEKVKDFLKGPKKMWINGQEVFSVSGKTFTVENPANGDHLTQVTMAQKEDVEMAVNYARTAFDHGPWTKLTASERAKYLYKLADLIEANTVPLAQLESLDNGKPLTVAQAADVPLSAEIFRYMAGWCTKIHGKTIPLSVPYTPKTRYLAYTLKEPVGVAAQIIPWNFPLLMAAWKLAPALAAGCVVVLKPAEQTPLTALYLGKLIHEAGFPAGVVQILTGFGDAGAALSSHPLVDKVAFTGSTEVGKLIVQAAAGNLKKVTLELGGKSPNVIFKDANVEKAIQGAASAIFFNHGQCCCAGSRLYVEKDIFHDVVDGIAKIAKNIRVGDGFLPDTEMGPLVSREQYDRVQGYIQSGLQEGAKLVTGPTTLNRPGHFVTPTVMTGVHSDMKIVKEEIFGPVVCAQPFSDMEEVVRMSNQSEYGLAAGIWTQDLQKAHALSARLRAGTTWINCYNVFDAALPFGGYKQSGWGREMGEEALNLYLETKSVCLPLN